jgi:hypothetical protein
MDNAIYTIVSMVNNVPHTYENFTSETVPGSLKASGLRAEDYGDNWVMFRNNKAINSAQFPLFFKYVEPIDGGWNVVCEDDTLYSVSQARNGYIKDWCNLRSNEVITIIEANNLSFNSYGVTWIISCHVFVPKQRLCHYFKYVEPVEGGWISV